jgi:hypothetical protein
MRLLTILTIAAIATGAATTARADVIFSDDFDTTGGSFLNWNGGANWDVMDGTVDLVANGQYSINCLGNTGHCVDMDGSTRNAGSLVSINIGPLAAGAYEFSYWLSGNQRNTAVDVVVAIAFGSGGDFTSATHSLAGDEWQQFTQTFSLASVTDPVQLRFNGSGSDNIGVVLDSVVLRAVPEPGSLALLGLGLMGMGLARRRTT